MRKRELWLEVIDRLAQDAAKAIAELPDDELAALATAADNVTNTNCWYVIYAAAPFMSGVARDVLANRITKDESEPTP